MLTRESVEGSRTRVGERGWPCVLEGAFDSDTVDVGVGIVVLMGCVSTMNFGASAPLSSYGGTGS